MKTLKLMETVNGRDLIIENGSFVKLDDLETLRQRLELTLKTIQGDWILDPETGMDWDGVTGGKNNAPRLLQREIERILLEDSEVESVEEITVEPDRSRRIMRVTFTVESIYGSVEGTI